MIPDITSKGKASHLQINYKETEFQCWAFTLVNDAQYVQSIFNLLKVHFLCALRMWFEGAGLEHGCNITNSLAANPELNTKKQAQLCVSCSTNSESPAWVSWTCSSTSFLKSDYLLQALRSFIYFFFKKGNFWIIRLLFHIKWTSTCRLLDPKWTGCCGELRWKIRPQKAASLLKKHRGQNEKGSDCVTLRRTNLDPQTRDRRVQVIV